MFGPLGFERLVDSIPEKTLPTRLRHISESKYDQEWERLRRCRLRMRPNAWRAVALALCIQCPGEVALLLNSTGRTKHDRHIKSWLEGKLREHLIQFGITGMDDGAWKCVKQRLQNRESWYLAHSDDKFTIGMFDEAIVALGLTEFISR